MVVHTSNPRAGGAFGSASLAESVRDLVSKNRQDMLVREVNPGTLQAEAAESRVQEF